MTLIDKTDEQLMELVVQRNQHALSILYDKYAGVVMGTIINVVGDSKIAEDVVQETFWRVWDKSESFDVTKGKFTTWMFSIARRHAIDVYRRQKVRPQAAKNEETLFKFELQPDTIDVAQSVSDRLMGETIKKALNTLSNEQRQVIEMAYFEGKTRREIAEKTDTPLGTIHTRVRLALKNLSNALRNHR